MDAEVIMGVDGCLDNVGHFLIIEQGIERKADGTVAVLLGDRELSVVVPVSIPIELPKMDRPVVDRDADSSFL